MKLEYSFQITFNCHRGQNGRDGIPHSVDKIILVIEEGGGGDKRVRPYKPCFLSLSLKLLNPYPKLILDGFIAAVILAIKFCHIHMVRMDAMALVTWENSGVSFHNLCSSEISLAPIGWSVRHLPCQYSQRATPQSNNIDRGQVCDLFSAARSKGGTPAAGLQELRIRV